VFILTHHQREPVEMAGGTTFHFVTDGIERALERAKEAAGGRDVRIWGGAQVIQQYLAAGLLDELELHFVPVLLGGGARLFDNLGGAEIRLEQVRGGRGARRHARHVPRAEMNGVARGAGQPICSARATMMPAGPRR
jgi:dihydrofolate reductase